MSLVVDASVAYKWFVNEQGSGDAVALRSASRPLIAPDLIVSEVCNSAWKSFRRGELSIAQCGIVATAIERSLAWLVPSAPLASAAMRMATTLDHPIYDCLYLALAERESTVLVTVDRRLLNRLVGTAYSGLARPL
jgi:predicted nucleic acid-binding protein